MQRTLVALAFMALVSSSVVPPAGGRANAATCVSTQGPGIPPPDAVSAGVPGFHAAWYGQSGYQSLCPGQTASAVVAFYNSGSQGWVSGRMGEVAYLGTWGPEPGQDMPSAVGGDGQLGSPATGWPRYNRVAVQPADYVGPGQIAWFQFRLLAPTTPGTYRLGLRPLIEGATWMEDYGVFWIFTVLPADGGVGGGAPPTPPPGGTATPAPPGTGTPAPSTTPAGSAGFVGDAAVEGSSDPSAAGVAEATRFTATASGPVTSLSIYLDASNQATSFALGLYGDGGAAPGSLLAQGSRSSAQNSAWNTVAISPTTVTSGTEYWIARLGTAAGSLVTRVNPAASNADRVDTRGGLGSLPATFSPGGSFPHVTSIYAGNAAPSTPTPSPTAPGTFTCTQVIGYSQTSNWYSIDVSGAFESVVVDARYQLLWNGGAAVHFWGDASYAGWGNAPYSACSSSSSAPDRVILDVTEDFFVDSTTVGQVANDIRAAVATIQSKYSSSLRQIYLQPVVGGPGGTTLCYINGTVIRASVNHPFIDQAIDQVVNGTSVRRGPSPTVRTCADYLDDGQFVGHLVTGAEGPIGQAIGAFYAPLP